MLSYSNRKKGNNNDIMRNIFQQYTCVWVKAIALNCNCK